VAPLTLASLRHLARLHRTGVDGAEAQLAAIIEERADELPAALGFPMKNLERLRAHEDPVQILVATIEGAPRVARAMRDRHQFEAAVILAVRLAQTAERREDGHLGLDVALLGETLAAYPGRVVTFGVRGSVGAGRLRAVVRNLRGMTSAAVTVTNEHVVVVYAGERMRGCLKLVLHPPVVDGEALIVPFDLDIAHEAPVVEQEALRSLQARAVEHEPDNCVVEAPASAAFDARGGAVEPESTSATPETVLGPRRPSRMPLPSATRRPERRFALRFVEALASAVLGGGP
jgi:hypothetical protein